MSMKNEYIELIYANLFENKEQLTTNFAKSSEKVGVRYGYLDNLLPEAECRRIYEAFPAAEEMRLMSSFREQKRTSKNFEKFDPLLKDITFAMQDHRVVRLIEEITGIENQIPDPSLYAGGLSMMGNGDFLNPHIDNSHEATRKYYRTLNMLFYVTPDWSLECGGNLELWDESVHNKITIVSKFNRLVFMETTPSAWHSVSRVVDESYRCCVSNYYFSPDSPTGKEHFHVTSFSAPPEQKIKRIASKLDNLMRQGLRRIRATGFGKVDSYAEK